MISIKASDRSALIRLASSLPKGDESRRNILKVLKEAASDSEFEKYVEGKRFKNPETGNKVLYVSLPPEEQKRIRDRFDSKSDKSNPEAEKNYETARTQAVSQIREPFTEYGAGAYPDEFDAVAKTVVENLSKQMEQAIKDGKLNSASANKLWAESMKELSSNVDEAFDMEIDHSDNTDDKEWAQDARAGRRNTRKYLSEQKKRKF